MKEELPQWFKKREKKEYNEIQLWMVLIVGFILGFGIGATLIITQMYNPTIH